MYSETAGILLSQLKRTIPPPRSKGEGGENRVTLIHYAFVKLALSRDCVNLSLDDIEEGLGLKGERYVRSDYKPMANLVAMLRAKGELPC